MSDQVGNPKDQFSQAEAHYRPGLILFVNHDYFYSIEIFFQSKIIL